MLSKLFFAFILLLSTAVYAQRSQGKVYAEDKPLEGVLIINKTQDLMTSTNRWGDFEIAAQLGDSLIFSYSFFETQIHQVEAYQLEETWVVELQESRNELDAVTITATNKVKEFRVKEYDKNFNTWLQKDIQEHPELYS
ncbi:MAG: carboxypeptidase-like regulatory domain-containing protein, partial [Bacteroidota bacterium]|nr:carboxypeptidase-like regulatory domain-containing protein [Bacteroidota bacterium]